MAKRVICLVSYVCCADCTFLCFSLFHSFFTFTPTFSDFLLHYSVICCTFSLSLALSYIQIPSHLLPRLLFPHTFRLITWKSDFPTLFRCFPLRAAGKFIDSDWQLLSKGNTSPPLRQRRRRSRRRKRRRRECLNKLMGRLAIC